MKFALLADRLGQICRPQIPRVRRGVAYAGVVSSILIIGISNTAIAFPKNSTGADSATVPPGPADRITPERLAAALTRAGSNRPAIAAFLDSYADASAEQRAARFLIANMPTVDLVTLSVDNLRENLAYAFKAKRELPWIHELPFNIFLHYVLPHRVTQEAYEPWRRELFEQLAPLLAECNNMTEAAVAVNRWCGQRVSFKQTEYRDQNVMATLRSGIGRCEEMMIVSIAALRSVGIPARACSAPWWVVTDNNHAWVEVWADGAWHYLGGCEPAAELNRAWFSGAAQRAGTVISQMYGSPREFPTGEVVCREMDNLALINSTAVYAMTGAVEIVVLDHAGMPVVDCPVSVAVFNFGGLRPLNVQRTDSEGRTTFVMGLGDYFFAAGNDTEGRGQQVITTLPGEQFTATLKLQPGSAPAEAFWLRYPTATEARRWAAQRERTSRAEVEIRHRPEINQPVERDLYTVETVDPQFQALLAGTADPQAWQDILAEARANWRAIADAVTAFADDGAKLNAALEFMRRTSKVDRLEITTATIQDHVTVAAEYRRPQTADEHYFEFVLNARIAYEHLTPWRGQLTDSLNAVCNQPTAKATAEALSDWINRNITTVERTRLGASQNPGQVLRSRHANQREKICFAVGALRSFGVPARTNSLGDRVEFLSAGNWQQFDPGDADSFRLVANITAETSTQPDTENAEIEIPGQIQVQLTRDGKPLTHGFNGLDVAKFNNGSWAPLRDYAHAIDAENQHNITLPAGEYLVTAGIRNPNGDPYVRTRLVELPPGGKIQLNWALDLPADSGTFKFPQDRELKEFPENIIITDRATNQPLDLTNLSGESALLLFFFRVDDEPSLRMLPLVNQALPALQEVGVKVIGIALPAALDVPLAVVLERVPADFQVVEGTPRLAHAFGLEADEPLGLFRPMPSVLLLQKGGQPILWLESLNLDLDRLLQDAARQVN